MTPAWAKAELTRVEPTQAEQAGPPAGPSAEAEKSVASVSAPESLPSAALPVAPAVLLDRSALLDERAYWLRRRNGARAAGILIPLSVIMMASSAAPLVIYRAKISDENSVFAGYPNYTENPQENAKAERIRAAGRGLAITGAIVFAAGVTAAILGTSESKRSQELRRIDRALASLGRVAQIEPWMQLGRAAGGTAGGVTGTLSF
jgi:hypothetical protein